MQMMKLAAATGLALLLATPAMAQDLAYFKAQLDPYRQKPKFEAAGPAFDAKRCMAGKKILTIPVTAANPFNLNIYKGMVKASKAAGFELVQYENQGQPAQWAQGVNHAINNKFDLIDMVGGTDPRVLVPQMQAAK